MIFSFIEAQPYLQNCKISVKTCKVITGIGPIFTATYNYMIKLSAVVITYNEERNIERCLNSVKGIADELIVVDSDSSDRTIPIAKANGATVIIQPFLGYGAQRIFTDSCASNDWVLMLDADEWVSEELAASILEFKKGPTANACKFARLNKYRGKWIKHGTWYPDRKIRLYDRTKGTWKGGNVHEYWEAYEPNEKIQVLKGDLLHDSFPTLEDHLNKIEKYSDIGARDAIAKGKKASIFKMLFSPVWSFITNYIIRAGFLDGYEGFLIAKLSARMSFLKYSKIRAYGRTN